MSWRARGIALSFTRSHFFFSFVVLVSQSEEGREGRRNTYCTPTTDSEALGLVCFLSFFLLLISVCWRFNWNESNIILGVGEYVEVNFRPQSVMPGRTWDSGMYMWQRTKRQKPVYGRFIKLLTANRATKRPSNRKKGILASSGTEQNYTKRVKRLLEKNECCDT